MNRQTKLQSRIKPWVKTPTGMNTGSLKRSQENFL